MVARSSDEIIRLILARSGFCGDYRPGALRSSVEKLYSERYIFCVLSFLRGSLMRDILGGIA